MITFRFKENELEKKFKFACLQGDNDAEYPVNPVNALQRCLEEISEPQLRSNFVLKVSNMVITRPVLVLLIQLLNHPFSDFIEPTQGKWDLVKFYECRLAIPDALQTLDDELYCAPVDIHTFASTVSRRVLHLSLTVNEYPDILRALGDLTELHIVDWSIVKEVFTPLDCESLADSLQMNEAPIQTVKFTSRYIEDPLVLQVGLENVVNLFITGYDRSFSDDSFYSNPPLCDSLFGEDGNGLLPRLLQSPLSDLESLILYYTHLDDHHIIALVDSLGTSELEALKIQCNNYTLAGITAFAHQLPSITRLKKVEIYNLWEDVPYEDDLIEPYEALRVGMKYNYSIETICITRDNSNYYVHKRLTYYADLNRAGRRILFTTKSVPAGLWPLILERAGTKCLPTESSRANAIYFFLQHCPDISCIHK